MVGLGEIEAEVIALLNDLKDHDVDLVTIGQYLQPSKSHAPIHRFVNLQEFERYTQHGQRLGFKISGVRQWSVLAILPIGNISVNLHQSHFQERMFCHRARRNNKNLPNRIIVKPFKII